MYTFEYTLEEADYVEFNRHVFYRSRQMRKNMLWLRFGVAVVSLALLPVAARLFYGNPALWVAYVVLVVFPIGWVIFFDRFLSALFRRIIRRGGFVFGQNITVVFDGKVIIEKTASGENRTSYDSIKKIADERQGVYVYVDDVRAVILPNRVFESDSQRQELIKSLVP